MTTTSLKGQTAFFSYTIHTDEREPTVSLTFAGSQLLVSPTEFDQLITALEEVWGTMKSLKPKRRADPDTRTDYERHNAENS